jgi:hypothetical protein
VTLRYADYVVVDSAAPEGTEPKKKRAASKQRLWQRLPREACTLELPLESDALRDGREIAPALWIAVSRGT